jgi:hypothetical protein
MQSAFWTKSNKDGSSLAVPTPRSKESEALKSSDVTLAPPELLTPEEWKARMRLVHLARPMGKGGRSKLAETRTWLTNDISFNSGVNTSIAAVTNVTPMTCNDYASYASLYDQVKVHAVKVAATYLYSVPSTVYGARTIVTIGFDPSDATVPASTVDQLSVSQHAGPWLITSPYFAAVGQPYQQAPGEVIMTRGGFHMHKFVIPRGSARSSANVATMGNEWADTADALDYWGFLKTYVEAGGAAGVIAVRYFLFLDVSFRSRH